MWFTHTKFELNSSKFVVTTHLPPPQNSPPLHPRTPLEGGWGGWLQKSKVAPKLGLHTKLELNMWSQHPPPSYMEWQLGTHPLQYLYDYAKKIFKKVTRNAIFKVVKWENVSWILRKIVRYVLRHLTCDRVALLCQPVGCLRKHSYNDNLCFQKWVVIFIKSWHFFHAV